MAVLTQFETRMFPPCHQSADTSSSNETTTRLLVSGHASMEDLWALFSSFGAVSSIVLVEGGAKVNFLQEETLSKFYQSGEIAFGAERLVVTKIKERKGQESLSMRFSLPPAPPPPPAPAPSPVQSDWSLTAPPPLTFTPLVLQPHLALPPFSPQYEASVVRSPQPTPPAQHQPEIFTFDTSSFLETESVCPVPRQEHFLQPLTPLTPGPLPPLPPAQKTCQANSFFFPPSCSSDSSDTARPSTVFSSPYKKFVKFKVALNMITEAFNELIIYLVISVIVPVIIFPALFPGRSVSSRVSTEE